MAVWPHPRHVAASGAISSRVMKASKSNPERTVAFVLLAEADEGVRGLLNQVLAHLPAGEESTLDWRFLAQPTAEDAMRVLERNDPATTEIGRASCRERV